MSSSRFGFGQIGLQVLCGVNVQYRTLYGDVTASGPLDYDAASRGRDAANSPNH